VTILKGAAAAIATLGLAACHTAAPPPAADTARVEASVATAEQVDWPSTFEAGGVVRAALSATVSSRIIAPVVAVHVNAGDPIRRGQPLVTLDAREPRANADRAAAALSAARESTRAADANGQAAEAALTLARASHGRVHTLHDTRSATPQELDDAVATVSGATARLSGARAQAAAAAAALEAAQAAMEAAQVGLSYTVLTAPFDGVVASRSVDPGALAMPGMDLLAIESGTAYRLDVQVDESRRSLLAPSNEAEVRFETSGQGSTWTKARIAEIARVDPRQHNFLVKLDLSPVTGLHSGAFGRARFFGPVRQTLAVPASTVVRRGQLWFAFALDRDDVARLRVFTPGELHENRVEIQSGLNAGDRLVVDPPATLEDGARIRVRTPAAAHQPSTGASR
jgi:multidrug efflux pump subunit AcrA (membrane-fusion protein)